MKKTIQTLSIIFFGLFLILPKISFAEFVRDFYSEINILPDSSFVVRENIVYDFDDSMRRGIYRYIPLSLNGKNIHINIISVKDDNGQNYKYTTEYKDSVLNIKIGDPNILISGVKTYKIFYQVTGGILYNKDFDQLYWNVTGNDWKVPIMSVRAVVNLPANVLPQLKGCYFGKAGEKNICKISDSNLFLTERTLSPKEGMTIDVGFKKGVVAQYESHKENVFVGYLKIFWIFLIPILVFILMFLRWFKVGRDQKGKGVIVYEHDIPMGLSPIESSLVLYQKIIPESISAEIINLAINGYLKIRPIDKGGIGNNFKKDYELTLLKEYGYIEKDHDVLLLKLIFGDKGYVGGVANISCFKGLLDSGFVNVEKSAKQELLDKKFYSNFSGINQDRWFYLLIFLFLSFVVYPFLGSGKFFGFNENLDIKIISWALSLLVSICFVLVFNYLMPAKTRKGAVAKERLLGLRLYIDKAEKSRIAFHSDPESNSNIFDKLLPYAILFKMETKWVKQFEELQQKNGFTPNSVLLSSNFLVYSDISLFNSVCLNSFSQNLSTCQVSSSSVSGGFGGGGGGSW